MMTVHEVSAITGVTIRTLRYYDRIGLLKPAAHTEAGYRLYDDATLMKLQRILLLRELEIPLRDVARLLTLSETAQREAIGRQITLLELKQERTEKLIALARRLSKGEETMDFSVFDRSKEEAYAAEAKARWGETEAYGAYEKKAASRTEAEGSLLAGHMMQIFADFGALRDGDPASEAAQAKVRELQDFISAHYYPCNDAILMGLGQMYVADERFRANIDAAGGEGTAVLVQKAIVTHCKREV